MRAAARWALVAVAVAAAAVAVAWFAPTPADMPALVSPGPLSSGHTFLERDCRACHDPVVGVTVARCTPCHAAAEQLLARQSTAFHASVGECAPCHLEHHGAGGSASTMDHGALAALGVRALERAAADDAESAATLRGLATWLRLDALRDIEARGAREVLTCAACHDRRDPHGRRFGEDCALCHSFDVWTVAGYRHPSPRSRECVQCHAPPPSHIMEHFAMVSQRVARKEKARVEDCFECHQTTSWNDIVGVGFYKHH